MRNAVGRVAFDGDRIEIPGTAISNIERVSIRSIEEFDICATVKLHTVTALQNTDNGSSGYWSLRALQLFRQQPFDFGRDARNKFPRHFHADA